ncbi:MAG: Transcriptional regulator, MerR family [uncultured Caballeronia sp.]|nr:MAG: Transcriptional regulator, MerR family [uncultured Caballeronia sp.]
MRIGELAKMAQCTTETIRFYEKEGLLPHANRTDSNYRNYTEAHAERLRFIRNCRALDMTHDEIRHLLSAIDAPGEPCGSINSLVDEHILDVDRRIEELTQLKAQLRGQCTTEESATDCGIIVQALSTNDVAPAREKRTHLG